METWQKKKTSKIGSRKNYAIYPNCTIQRYDFWSNRKLPNALSSDNDKPEFTYLARKYFYRIDKYHVTRETDRLQRRNANRCKIETDRNTTPFFRTIYYRFSGEFVLWNFYSVFQLNSWKIDVKSSILWCDITGSVELFRGEFHKSKK